MKKFDRGRYREFQLPQWFNGPEPLTETLYQVWNRGYRDLYERGGECDVEEAFEEVIEALGMPGDFLSHWRYAYMAWILSLAVMPAIKHYYTHEVFEDIALALGVLLNPFSYLEYASMRRIFGLKYIPALEKKYYPEEAFEDDIKALGVDSQNQQYVYIASLSVDLEALPAIEKYYYPDEALEDKIEALGVPVDRLSHWRYSYMAWIFSLTALPTIQHYYPEDWKYFLLQKKVVACLEEGSEVPEELANTLFAKPTIGNYQAADEAYNVLYNSLKVLHQHMAYDAVIDILYDAITGDAISGFVAAKRDIFNWWLIEVIPAAYYLKSPSNLYSGKWDFPQFSKCSES